MRCFVLRVYLLFRLDSVFSICARRIWEIHTSFQMKTSISRQCVIFCSVFFFFAGCCIYYICIELDEFKILMPMHIIFTLSAWCAHQSNRHRKIYCILCIFFFFSLLFRIYTQIRKQQQQYQQHISGWVEWQRVSFVPFISHFLCINGEKTFTRINIID